MRSPRKGRPAIKALEGLLAHQDHPDPLAPMHRTQSTPRRGESHRSNGVRRGGIPAAGRRRSGSRHTARRLDHFSGFAA